MVLRKPYAFLIKHFRKMNIVLLLLSLVICYLNLQLSDFVKDYLTSGYYNELLNSVTLYVNWVFYVSALIVIVISAIMAYLLMVKKKPVMLYIAICVEYIAVFIMFAVTSSYFQGLDDQLINLMETRLLRDFLFIFNMPQFVLVILLFIRSIGIDLKKFGFKEDKEYLEIREEDREEFEFSVEIDKDDLKRRIRKRIREMRYVYLEHKLLINTLVITSTIVLVSFGSYIYLTNHVTYRENQTFVAQNYGITVKNSYITDKDYAGNIVSQTDGKTFVIVELLVVNQGIDRQMDVQKFLLMDKNQYYAPVIKYNAAFIDLGTPYEKKTMKEGSKTNFLLIYEVDKSFVKKKNYALYYQEIIDRMTTKYRKVGIKPKDISEVKEDSDYIMGTALTINDKPIMFRNYQIASSFDYRYEKCNSNKCNLVNGTISSNNRKILELSYQAYDYKKQELLDLLEKQGKIVYQIDGQTYTSNLSLALSWNRYIGDRLYLYVDANIESAAFINLEITLRQRKLVYHIK